MSERLHFENRSHKHNCGDEPTAPGFFGYRDGTSWICTYCGKEWVFFKRRKGWYHYEKQSRWATFVDSVRRAFGVAYD